MKLKKLIFIYCITCLTFIIPAPSQRASFQSSGKSSTTQTSPNKSSAESPTESKSFVSSWYKKLTNQKSPSTAVIASQVPASKAAIQSKISPTTTNSPSTRSSNSQESLDLSSITTKMQDIQKIQTNLKSAELALTTSHAEYQRIMNSTTASKQEKIAALEKQKEHLAQFNNALSIAKQQLPDHIKFFENMQQQTTSILNNNSSHTQTRSSKNIQEVPSVKTARLEYEQNNQQNSRINNQNAEITKTTTSSQFKNLVEVRNTQYNQQKIQTAQAAAQQTLGTNPTKSKILQNIENIITKIKTSLNISATKQQITEITQKIKAKATSLPEAPTTLQVKQFIQNSIDAVKNLNRSENQTVTTEINPDGTKKRTEITFEKKGQENNTQKITILNNSGKPLTTETITEIYTPLNAGSSAVM